jgi:FKBP-type peptidyl-prolyl cis-trans isomerase
MLTGNRKEVSLSTMCGKNSYQLNQLERQMPQISDGLEYEDQITGEGEEATPGQTVEVHYTGWLTDGTEFDSSHKRNQTFSFKLGGGQVIQGWDQGVAGMKVGGVRKLTIAPEFGYGARGAGGVIPPNATLIFKVELISVS